MSSRWLPVFIVGTALLLGSCRALVDPEARPQGEGLIVGQFGDGAIGYPRWVSLDNSAYQSNSDYHFHDSVTVDENGVFWAKAPAGRYDLRFSFPASSPLPDFRLPGVLFEDEVVVLHHPFEARHGRIVAPDGFPLHFLEGESVEFRYFLPRPGLTTPVVQVIYAGIAADGTFSTWLSDASHEVSLAARTSEALRRFSYHWPEPVIPSDADIELDLPLVSFSLDITAGLGLAVQPGSEVRLDQLESFSSFLGYSTSATFTLDGSTTRLEAWAVAGPTRLNVSSPLAGQFLDYRSLIEVAPGSSASINVGAHRLDVSVVKDALPWAGATVRVSLPSGSFVTNATDPEGCVSFFLGSETYIVEAFSLDLTALSLVTLTGDAPLTLELE